LDTITITILVILGAIIALISGRRHSSGAKVIIYLFIISILILAVTTVLIFNDINLLKNDITKGKNMFLMMEGDNAYAGVAIKPITGGTFDFSSFEYYTDDDLKVIAANATPESNGIPGINRAFIMTPNALNKTYSIDLGIQLDQNKLIELLKSNDTLHTLAEKLSTDRTITKEVLQKAYGNESKIKGYILAALVINYFKTNTAGLTEDVKSGDVRVVPDTISFKVLRYLPLPSKN